MNVELASDYYLTNFKELIEYIGSTYTDLLSSEERGFLLIFSQLPRESQMLYIRMLTRKGEWFRARKLNYQEIPDLFGAVTSLEKSDLVQVYPAKSMLPLAAVIGLFTKAEWLLQLKFCGIDTASLKTLKRAALEERIFELAEHHSALSYFENEILFCLKGSAVFDTFKLLYFGNQHQDLTEFVLRDLGHYRYEDYLINRDTRSFQDKSQLQAHQHYYAIIEPLEEVLLQSKAEIIALVEQLPATPQSDRLLDRRIQSVKLRLARQLERLDAPQQALLIYQQCNIPPARERSARIFVKQQRIDEGLNLCREIIAQPRSEAEQQFGEGFGYRTARKHKLDWQAPSNYKPPRRTLTLTPTGAGVEVDVACYFSQNGECHFVENDLFSSLFGLLYWEVIFAPVKGAFTNPFQIRPHDLHEPDFLTQRQAVFSQANHALLSQELLNDAITSRWTEKFGIANYFVNWSWIDEALIHTALARIPLPHLKAIFQRIWQDIRANCSGFPDLILLTDTGYELIEVKGPGDTLQANQLRWMRYFHQQNIPHRVVYVEFDSLG